MIYRHYLASQEDFDIPELYSVCLMKVNSLPEITLV